MSVQGRYIYRRNPPGGRQVNNALDCLKEPSQAQNGIRKLSAGYLVGAEQRPRQIEALRAGASPWTRNPQRLRKPPPLVHPCNGLRERARSLLYIYSIPQMLAILWWLIVFLFWSAWFPKRGQERIPNSTSSAMAFAWRKHRFVASICHDCCWPFPASSAKSMGRKGRYIKQ